MAADIVSHGPWSPPAAGHRQDRQQAVRLRAAIPGVRVTQRPVRSRQLVVSRWTGSGIHPEPPHPPTGTGAELLVCVQATTTICAEVPARLKPFDDAVIGILGLRGAK